MHPFARPLVAPSLAGRFLADDIEDLDLVAPVPPGVPAEVAEWGPLAMRLWPGYVAQTYAEETALIQSGRTPGTAPFDVAARLRLRGALEELGVLDPIRTFTNAITLGAMPASVHQWARQVLLTAWRNRYGSDPTLSQIQSAQAIALLETSYGRGWPTAELKAANNWGAVQCSKLPIDGVCQCDGVLHEDSYPTANGNVKYAVCFRRYPTPEAGADSVLAHMSIKARPKTWAAMQTGDAVALSSAMYDERYYQGFGSTREQRIEGHVKAVERSVKAIAEAMGEPIAVARGGTSYGGGGASSDSGGVGLGPKIFLVGALFGAGAIIGSAMGGR